MRRNHIALLALACIVVLSAYLRFHNLATNPGWDGDEGYNLNIAWHLSQGRFQMFSMSYAFVQHPPLFYAILAPILGAIESDILALRLLAASYGVLTTIVLFFVARDMAGHKVAIFSTVLFAIYPVAVVYNRLGYSYNQLMFLAILCFYSTWKFVAASDPAKQRKWSVVAGLVAGLGTITDQEGVFLIIFVVLLIAIIRKRLLPIALMMSLLFPLAYVATMFATVPAEFLYDLQHNFGRVSGNGPLGESILVAFHYERFLDYSYWLPLGIVGLFLLPDKRAKLMAVSFFFLMLLLILKIRNPNPFFRTAIPVLPFVALGMGAFAEVAVRNVFNWVQETWQETIGQRRPSLGRPVATLATFALLFLPFSATLALDLIGVQTQLRTNIDSFLARSPDEAAAMAAFVNDRAQDGDVVIASSNVSWLFRVPSADLIQAVAAQGNQSAFYPADTPENRFVYDPRVSFARFVVLDDISRLWAQHAQTERAIVDEVVTSWRMVYKAGEYQVFEKAKLE